MTLFSKVTPDWTPPSASCWPPWRPPLFLGVQSVLHCTANVFPYLLFCVFFILSFLQLGWSQHWTYVLLSPPFLSVSLLITHSLLCTQPSGLCSYTLLRAICQRKVSYGLCVSLLSLCCLVVLVTCCPSLWRPSWNWWTTALSPGTLSLWPSSKRSAKKKIIKKTEIKLLSCCNFTWK